MPGAATTGGAEAFDRYPGNFEQAAANFGEIKRTGKHTALYQRVFFLSHSVGRLVPHFAITPIKNAPKVVDIPVTHTDEKVRSKFAAVS